VDRARSTSAAPIYFQSFKHNKTRKEYIDGAVLRNNPIRLANEERRLIWREGCSKPDIILSVGAGLRTDIGGATHYKKTSKTKVILKLVPKGIRKKITTGYDMVVSTMDCEKEWEEFTYSMQHDAGFVNVCHRVNVGLLEKPPKLDDINSMHSMQQESDNYLKRSSHHRYNDGRFFNAHAHIRLIARRLLASLFYFEEMTHQPETRQLRTARKITGFLRCRLSPSMRQQFRSLSQEKMEFGIYEHGSDTRELSKPEWDMESFCSVVEFLVNSDSWRIQVKFLERSNAWEPISGYCC
jgi:hypothetical protein